MDLAELLLAHAAARPAACAQDLLKLCYQAEFGACHLLSPGARDRLEAEYAAVPAADGALTEPVGGGDCRLQLGAAKAAGLSAELCYALFASARPRGSRKGLLARLSVLRQLCEAGRLPFSPKALSHALEPWEAQGFPPLSHSPAYRAAYAPAYRLISEQDAALLPVLCALSRRLSCGRCVLAVDGPCGSGKSTAAARLAGLLNGGLVHMDDFFLPPVLRTPQRLSVPGGNVHHERFCAEVLPHLGQAEAFSYGVYSCREQAITHTRTVAASPLTVVEGSYSRHPAFGPYAHLTLFVRASEAVRQARIAARDGEHALPAFRERWIPMETAYFETFDIEKQSDFILDREEC